MDIILYLLSSMIVLVPEDVPDAVAGQHQEAVRGRVYVDHLLSAVYDIYIYIYI